MMWTVVPFPNFTLAGRTDPVLASLAFKSRRGSVCLSPAGVAPPIGRTKNRLPLRGKKRKSS